jgi:lipoprotein
MERRVLLLICILFSSLGCLQVNAQSRVLRDFLVKDKSKQDTVIKSKTESYRFEEGDFLRNVKNKLDTVYRNNDPEEFGIKDEREKFQSALRKVFSQTRINELAKLKADFLISGVCDSIGYVKECRFFVTYGLDITLEEIEGVEKVMKDFKVTYNRKIPGVEYYDIIFPCRFVLWADNIPESEKHINIFRRR